MADIIDREFSGTYGSDLYYHPEKCGMELVASVERDDLSYEFDIFALWRDTVSGAYFEASDSSCSCPSPFEDYRKLSDLHRVEDEAAVRAAVDEWNAGYDGKPKVAAVEVEALLRTYRESVAEAR